MPAMLLQARTGGVPAVAASKVQAELADAGRVGGRQRQAELAQCRQVGRNAAVDVGPGQARLAGKGQFKLDRRPIALADHSDTRAGRCGPSPRRRLAVGAIERVERLLVRGAEHQTGKKHGNHGQGSRVCRCAGAAAGSSAVFLQAVPRTRPS